MSFRDHAFGSAVRNNRRAESTSEPGTAGTSRVVEAEPTDSHRGGRSAIEPAVGSPDCVSATEPSRVEPDSSKQEARQGNVMLHRGASGGADEPYRDAVVKRSTENKHGSSCQGSVCQSAGGSGHLSSRVICASAPISFTKPMGSGQQWGAYTRNAHGYLSAEAVLAAAAADESTGLHQPEGERRASEPGVPTLEGDSVKVGKCTVKKSTAVRSKEDEQRTVSLPSEDCSFRAASSSRDWNSPGKAHRGSEFQPPLGGGPAAVVKASPVEKADAALLGPRARGQRAFLGNWIFGSGGRGTEIERLLKEESDLSESIAAKRELAATKLVEEDMQAMIDNLQQVKAFLFGKLKECETALLTTAQERDDLELTLQHVQGGIQESVAENRRLIVDYKTKLAALESETQSLRESLSMATEETNRLTAENKTLKGEISLARAEAADVAAARGFHLEEYQTAVQILMERNKAQHRELKRLRGQLVKTREDYANALAKIDELETLVDFHSKEAQSKDEEEDTPAPTSGQAEDAGAGDSGHWRWRIPKIRGHSDLADHPDAHSDESPSASSARLGYRSDKDRKDHEASAGDPHLAGSCHSRDDGDRACATSDLEARGRDEGEPRESSGSPPSSDAAVGASQGASSLGRSVKGILASGVSRVLQHFERSQPADRDREESTEQYSDTQESNEEPKRLYEEAALFLQRVDGSSDIVVQLEEASELRQSDEDAAPGSSTLGNVAKTVWQAAHELLTDKSLPPARLSTLRAIAASNPSAWEVIRERHRAAKSMPLFSSIPPAAYPLIAERRNERHGGETTGLRASTAGRRDIFPSQAGDGARRGSRRRLPLSEASNTRFRSRAFRPRSDSVPSGTVTLELQAEACPRATAASSDCGEEEVLIWQEEVPAACSSAVESTPVLSFEAQRDETSEKRESPPPGISSQEKVEQSEEQPVSPRAALHEPVAEA